jgi:hypothetical protein
MVKFGICDLSLSKLISLEAGLAKEAIVLGFAGIRIPMMEDFRSLAERGSNWNNHSSVTS